MDLEKWEVHEQGWSQERERESDDIKYKIYKIKEIKRSIYSRYF